MQGIVYLNNILATLNNLSKSNKKWIADRLYEQINEEKKTKKLVFPKIPADFSISKATQDNVIGALPEGIDFEKETDKMWEELAK